MGKKSSPPPPDYAALAKAQGEANKEAANWTTNLNRVDQNTPYGSSTWQKTVDPVTGQDRWTNNVTLDPAQQQLLNSQNAISQSYANTAQAGLGRVADAMSKQFDTSGLPALQGVGTPGQSQRFNFNQALPSPERVNPGQMQMTGPDASKFQTQGLDIESIMRGMPATPSISGGGGITRSFDTSGVRKLPGQIDDASRRRVEEAIMSRINPQYAADEQALRTRLLNSGIEVGTDAYNREMANHSQRLNDARMQSVLAGGQEESRQTQLLAALQAQEFGQAEAMGRFGQNADIANANNSLQASIANANLQRGSAQDRISSLLAMQGLNMQGNQQNFNMGLKGAEFGNAAQQQDFAQRLASQGQDFTQRSQGQQQAFMQGLAGAQFNNAADQQDFMRQLQASGFNNQTRQQGLQEQAWLRQLPLNEVNALRTGSQVQGPQFNPYYTGGNAGAAPIFDAGIAQGNWDMQRGANNQSGMNAMLGGLAQLGSAWIGSDIRLKKNLTPIGIHPAGVRRYRWDWRDGSGEAVGVIAQELQAIRPDAVSLASNGFLQVNYSAIGGF